MNKKNKIIILCIMIVIISIIVVLLVLKIHKEKIQTGFLEENHQLAEKYNDTKSTNSYTPENTLQNSNNINTKHETVNQQELENRTVENVKVEILEDTISKTGATVIITDNNEISFSWNKELFRIEQKKEGNWSEVNPNRDGFDLLLIGYGRDENNQFKFALDWEEYYGSLENGIYRVAEMPTDAKGVIAYSNEFEI